MANDINGVIDYTIKQPGAFHMIGQDAYEPQRNNNFELHIYFGPDYSGERRLTTVNKGIEIDKTVAEDTLTLSTVSVSSLTTNVGVIPISYGNTKVKYAGLPEVGNSTIVFNDYIGRATERIITAWHKQVVNFHTQHIGRASIYKKQALLVETAPDGTNARAWQIYGCWPSDLVFGEYSYQNGGQVRQINLTLVYDWMEPLDGEVKDDFSGVSGGFQGRANPFE